MRPAYPTRLGCFRGGGGMHGNQCSRGNIQNKKAKLKVNIIKSTM